MATSLSAGGQSPDRILLPKISLIYLQGGSPFDRECGSLLEKPIQEEWVQETANRLDEFQALWDKKRNSLYANGIREVGVPVPYREMQATVTVCDFSSMGAPLIIYVRIFLRSADKPQPVSAFSEVVFHDVMHTYARDIDDRSHLRKKYASELEVTVNHLHVMALEKSVLVKLNKPDVLKWVDNRYRNRFPPAYKRAWEIVNDIEGHKPFINELKTMGTAGSVK